VTLVKRKTVPAPRLERVHSSMRFGKSETRALPSMITGDLVVWTTGTAERISHHQTMR